MTAKGICRVGHCLLGITVLLVSSACAHFDGPKTARYWLSPQKGEKYPEQEEDSLMAGDTFGIAFYGGGTRSAPATIGQIRMLVKLGWFQKAQYVSTISGGTWGAAPYLFLPDNYFESRAYALAKREVGRQTSKESLQRSAWFDSSEVKSREEIDEEIECSRKNHLHKLAKEAPPVCNRNTDEIIDAAHVTGQCLDELFLSTYLTPSLITESTLTSDSELSNYSYLKIMADNSLVFEKSMESWFWDFQGDEVFADVLGKIFLEDLGLYKESSLVSHATNSAIAYDKDLISQLTPTVNNYVFPRNKMPFLIAGTTLMKNSSNQKSFYRFEMTPLYTGSLGEHSCVASDKDDGLDDGPRGSGCRIGGYIETYAFDTSYELASNSTVTNVKYYTAFSLADMMAASGAAPAQTLFRIGSGFYGISGASLTAGLAIHGIEAATWPYVGASALAFGIGYTLHGNAGFPEFRYVNFVGERHIDDNYPYNPDMQQDSFGDGGHLENSGIMSLLARKVKRILVFVNSQKPFRKDPLSGQVEMDRNLISLFQTREYFDEVHGQNKNKSEISKIYHHYPYNGVFQAKELVKLVDTFAEKDTNDQPLVSCGTYSVQENKHYNIAAYNATICWVYLQRSQKWLSELETGACSNHNCKELLKLKNLQDDFKHFPNYWTFMNSLSNEDEDRQWSLIKISEPQANALSQFTSWIVEQSAAEIGAYLNLIPAR